MNGDDTINYQTPSDSLQVATPIYILKWLMLFIIMGNQNLSSNLADDRIKQRRELIVTFRC
jgi:hypothetical protein